MFQRVPRVAVLELKGNPLVTLEHETFAFLPRLQKLYVDNRILTSPFFSPSRRFCFFFKNRILSEVKELRHFPSLNGTSSLELIRIDRARIGALPSDLCRFCPFLRSL